MFRIPSVPSDPRLEGNVTSVAPPSKMEARSGKVHDRIQRGKRNGISFGSSF